MALERCKIYNVKRDISDRLKAELALKKSEERLELVLWGSKDGFWDWNIQSNQIFYSTRWKEMRGFAEITLSVSPQAIQVYADCDRIIQVLTSLLSNAIKFSPEGSTIWLTVEKQEASQQVLFKVKDQGRGIPRDKLKSIFERFQQVDASDSRKKGGTGLGLAICHSIVEQHEGKIWVESVLGQGSTFCFTLSEASISV